MTFAQARTLPAALLLIVALAPGAAANLLDRDEDPVVITAQDAGGLVGRNPDTIVGFRYDSGWTQIPVQVDERAFVDFGAPYDTLDFGIGAIMYVDEGTFTGPDPDPAFDLDDELVFLTRAGGGDEKVPYTEPYPPGTVAGSRLEVMITNPLNGLHGYVYLFESDGTLDPAAGQDHVDYQFDLLSGDYKTTYGILSGPNPENSVVTTPYYSVHFSDRWIRDEIRVTAGTATGVDILDRHKNLFGPGVCQRSENTFSNGEGCFVANIDGPVRAIRSYLGANSGPFTQRVHKFYERRHDVVTHLRVHAISGVMDYYDYGPDAVGMTYHNDLNPDGVTVDGLPDAVTAGPLAWEMLTGGQGTLAIALGIETDIPGFAYTTYYSDDDSPSVTQCTGDADEYGASGAWVNQPIPNTDPYLGAPYFMRSWRTVYYEEPNQPVAVAEARNLQARTPLRVLVTTDVAETAPEAPVALAQNVPNPFNGTTVIGFRAPPGAAADLKIHDLAGRAVRSFAVTASAEGRGSVTWDGRDESGRSLPSGVYFARITAGPHAETRKMVYVP